MGASFSKPKSLDVHTIIEGAIDAAEQISDGTIEEQLQSIEEQLQKPIPVGHIRNEYEKAVKRLYEVLCVFKGAELGRLERVLSNIESASGEDSAYFVMAILRKTGFVKQPARWESEILKPLINMCHPLGLDRDLPLSQAKKYGILVYPEYAAGIIWGLLLETAF